ncbi:hypothetical protein GOODEAATRI_034157, partial [Goodea atripinnis]
GTGSPSDPIRRHGRKRLIIWEMIKPKGLVLRGSDSERSAEGGVLSRRLEVIPAFSRLGLDLDNSLKHAGNTSEYLQQVSLRQAGQKDHCDQNLELWKTEPVTLNSYRVKTSFKTSQTT